MEKKKTNRKGATDWFNEQIVELKRFLPKNYKSELLQLLPEEYDSMEGGRIIDNCMNYRSTDMVVLEAVKILAEKYKNMQLNLNLNSDEKTN